MSFVLLLCSVFVRISPENRQHLRTSHQQPASHATNPATRRVRLHSGSKPTSETSADRRDVQVDPNEGRQNEVEDEEEDAGEALLHSLDPKQAGSGANRRATPFTFQKTFLEDDIRQHWNGVCISSSHGFPPLIFIFHK